MLNSELTAVSKVELIKKKKTKLKLFETYSFFIIYLIRKIGLLENIFRL